MNWLCVLASPAAGACVAPPDATLPVIPITSSRFDMMNEREWKRREIRRTSWKDAKKIQRRCVIALSHLNFTYLRRIPFACLV